MADNVRHCMRMRPKRILLGEARGPEMISILVDVLKRGIPARALASLAEALKLTMPTLAAAVLIPQRTLERRLAVNSVLKTDEAERALRLARLFAKAKDVFEDGDEAAEWFASEDDSSPFSFVAICQLFELEPEDVHMHKVL